MRTAPATDRAPSAGSAPAWGHIVRVIVALFFLAAAVGKIAEPDKFAQEIQKYQLVPIQLTHGMAIVIPWLEVVCVALLLSGLWRREARLLILLMLVVFTGAKISVEIRGLNIDCGCFGGLFAFLAKIFHGWYGIALNVGLIGLLGVDWLIARKIDATRAAAAEDEPAPDRAAPDRADAPASA